jgi:exosortase/archaeosortase
MLVNVVLAGAVCLGAVGVLLGALLNSGTPTARGLRFTRALIVSVPVLWVLALVGFGLVYAGA